MKPLKQPIKISSSDLVASALLERIMKAEWRVGDKIPSVDQLEHLLPMSRVTICKGIKKLCQQGYLHSEWRQGTYVSSAAVVRRILLHTGGDQTLMGEYPFGRVVTRKVEALLTSRGMQAEIHWEARQRLAGSRLATDLQEGHFAGAISVASNLPVMLKESLPAVLGRLPVAHVGVHHHVPWVEVNFSAFGRHAVALCRQAGARRVVLFGDPTGPLTAEFAQLARGLTVQRFSPANGPWPEVLLERESYALFLHLWRSLNGAIDAVVVPDDIQAKGIVQAILSLGPQVAERVRIVAQTNKDSGVFYPLPVAAVEVDTDAIAQQTVALLERQFAEGVMDGRLGVSIEPHPIAATHDAFMAPVGA